MMNGDVFNREWVEIKLMLLATIKLIVICKIISERRMNYKILNKYHHIFLVI